MPRIRFGKLQGARVISLAALVCLCACKEKNDKPDGGPGPGTEDVRKNVLSAAGTCVLTHAREFQTAAAALETATSALVSGPEASTRQAAREAFHRAMDVWQVLEVLQIGPAATTLQPGGAEIRDNIYSWPLVNRCAVEEQIVARGYESASFPTTLVSRRGLNAMEYLLFYEGSDTACAASSPIVSQGTWAALSAEERDSRKRAYALAAAKEVRRHAERLVQAWEGGFAQTLETAGAGNTVYPTTQAALNSLSDALFYVEHDVKDLKLARPLGLRECTSDVCPEFLESRYASRSKANLRSNLVGFRKLSEGCGQDFSGPGFDDLLVSVGADTLAGKLRTNLIAAQAALEAINEPDLDQALTQDKASVRAFYDALKAGTDLIKTEFVTTLDLELPQSVEGDND
ncbi:imelysin family protein [Hyalangium gracile]|uniref:imelysin family protein n=1 Tax=Hyalangium gracile TaxID=394092 RepID=UPI001CCE1C29|nr:imelysin family protein [Hyalangium gracile]